MEVFLSSFQLNGQTLLGFHTQAELSELPVTQTNDESNFQNWLKLGWKT